MFIKYSLFRQATGAAWVSHVEKFSGLDTHSNCADTPSKWTPSPFCHKKRPFRIISFFDRLCIARLEIFWCLLSLETLYSNVTTCEGVSLNIHKRFRVLLLGRTNFGRGKSNKIHSILYFGTNRCSSLKLWIAHIHIQRGLYSQIYCRN